MDANVLALKKALKGVPVPGGKLASYDAWGYSWNKKGGYFYKLWDIMNAALACGWVKSESKSGNSPDGNVSSDLVVLEKDNIVLIFGSSYGVEKASNRFNIYARINSRSA